MKDLERIKFRFYCILIMSYVVLLIGVFGYNNEWIQFWFLLVSSTHALSGIFESKRLEREQKNT